MRVHNSDGKGTEWQSIWRKRMRMATAMRSGIGIGMGIGMREVGKLGWHSLHLLSNNFLNSIGEKGRSIPDALLRPTNHPKPNDNLIRNFNVGTLEGISRNSDGTGEYRVSVRWRCTCTYLFICLSIHVCIVYGPLSIHNAR